uniref:Fibronectin type-III domain-containing protein n=1 Tax=Leptobrachium leishanense TaxID=445787 RepID=A0A8C5QFI4_9ANUR
MPGTRTYTTEVVSGNRMEYLCQTSNTSCSTTDLLCGHQYNVTVMAMGQQCSSNVSNHLEFETAPCTPQNVVTVVDCISNGVAVSWSQCLGAESYSTSAARDDGDLYFCNSTDTHCTFHGLPCGRLFVVTVTSTKGRSSSRQSLPIKVQMAPCLPQVVSATVHCKTNYATVSWSRTTGAENYTTLVTGPDAVAHTCNTQNTSCGIPDLHCGIKYNVSVTAMNYQCQGQNSSIIPLLTAPCAPESVRAKTECVSGSVTLSWNQMDHVVHYTAYLMGVDGVNHTSNPTQANCAIPNLPCGQMYTLAVSAANSQCNGPLSNSIRVFTAPCIPLNVSTLLDCIDNSAHISWNPTRGAVNYTLTLNGPQESQNRSCATQDTFCRMRDLPCGKTFAVVVTAQNDICSSEENNLMALESCKLGFKNTFVEPLLLLKYKLEIWSINFVTPLFEVYGIKFVIEVNHRRS